MVAETEVNQIIGEQVIPKMVYFRGTFFAAPLVPQKLALFTQFFVDIGGQPPICPPPLAGHGGHLPPPHKSYLAGEKSRRNRTQNGQILQCLIYC